MINVPHLGRVFASPFLPILGFMVGLGGDLSIQHITTFDLNTSDVPIGIPVYSNSTCMADGGQGGLWVFNFSGFGCDKFENTGGKGSICLHPMTATKPGETHSGMVTGPSVSGAFCFSCNVITRHQLRQSSAPNPWEVGWIIWDYKDNEHFYYFIPKTNGWELGKRDPKFPGGQKFLKTDSDPKFPLGKTYSVLVEQIDSLIKVSVDGHLLASFKDPENVYKSGRIGFYSEDSDACCDTVMIVKTKSSAPK